MIVPASSSPAHTIYAYSKYVCVYKYDFTMHTHTQMKTLAARAFILPADRKCFAQLKQAKAGTMTADLLINKVI